MNKKELELRLQEVGIEQRNLILKAKDLESIRYKIQKLCKERKVLENELSKYRKPLA